MRDTTQWRRDIDRLRQKLLAAYRTGDIDTIADATQSLQALLQRSDRTCGTASPSTTDHTEASMPPASG
jgi:hypothetical protein